MGSNAVKTIVMLMVLVVVSVFIGAQTSEGVKDGIMALGGVIAALCLITVMFFGAKSWWVVFLVPLFGSFLPELNFTGLPLGMILMPLLFAVWGLMWMMGLVKMRWRGVLVMDLAILLTFVWYLTSFIRFPVALSVMNLDYDYVGGKEYLFCLLGSICYLFYSVISFPSTRTAALVKVLFWCTIALSILRIPLNLMGLAGESLSVVSETASGDQHRVTVLVMLGSSLYAYVYNKYPMSAIFSSVWKMATLAFSVFSIVISGTREYLVRAAFCLSFFAFLKRELLVFAIAAMGIYGSLFVLSENDVIKKLPLGSQRTLLILPGIHGDEMLEAGAEGSTNWRTEIWGWALDPRTGYIRDYLFGDGFQTSRRSIVRANTAVMRGSMQIADQREYASRGVWHNGFITCLHRTGLVGVVLAFFYFGTALVYIIYVALAYGGSKGLWPLISVLVLQLLEQIFVYFYMGTIIDIFVTYPQYALLKVLYCEAREKGLLRPFFLKPQYVPLSIQALEDASAVAQAR